MKQERKYKKLKKKREYIMALIYLTLTVSPMPDSMLKLSKGMRTGRAPVKSSESY